MRSFIVVLVGLMLLGCASAGAAPKQQEAEPTADTRDIAIAALEARIEEPEAQLEAMEWTEAKAIAVVRWELAEFLRECDQHHCNSSHPAAVSMQELVEIAPFFNIKMATHISEVGYWSALRSPSSNSWLVKGGSGRYILTFQVYEDTGLVIGAAPSGE